MIMSGNLKIKFCTLFISLLLVTSLHFSGCENNKDGDDIFNGMNPLVFDKGLATVSFNGIKATFSEEGNLKNISGDGFSLNLEGVFTDIGIDGRCILNQMVYESFLDFNTWEMPSVNPTLLSLPELTTEKVSYGNERVVTRIRLDDIVWQYVYNFESDGILSVDVSITTDSDKIHHINGVTFISKAMDLDIDSTRYQFPGNSPYNLFNLANLNANHVGRANYSNPLVHFQEGDNHFNLLYINEHEKWSTGVYRDRHNYNHVTVANVAATESYLESGEILDELGTLYFMFPGDDPYAPVVDFYESNGWVAPTDGVNDGSVYSCHPFRTLDGPFSNLRTLQEFAEYIPVINEMGYKNIWLLPVLDHASGSVYASNNLHEIDVRYGGENGLTAFTSKASDFNMRVLMDYVPHGPYPYMPLARDNPKWSSKKMNGWQQIEWDSVSFDYNNPEFYDYVVESVRHHAADLGVKGARIDCAMGGLSNWDTLPGLRPSSSGLKAGVTVSRAIRQGFLEAGVSPIIFPENFHPVPFFSPYTDAFYDMPLYRNIYDLRNSGMTESSFASELSRWLSVQRATAPRGQVFLRYISNHDTVSWVWDRARPVDVYGRDKAKALWTLTHLIDGIPLIYQGDEDPFKYRGEGENIIAFFKDLNTARNMYLSHDYDIEYFLNNSAIIAFRRFTSENDRLVLINLSSRELSYDIEGYSDILYSNGNIQIKDSKARLSGYATVMLDKS